MMFKEGKNMSPDHIQDLRQDLQKFRSKIENGTIVKRISAYIVYSFFRLVYWTRYFQVDSIYLLVWHS